MSLKIIRNQNGCGCKVRVTTLHSSLDALIVLLSSVNYLIIFSSLSNICSLLMAHASSKKKALKLCEMKMLFRSKVDRVLFEKAENKSIKLVHRQIFNIKLSLMNMKASLTGTDSTEIKRSLKIYFTL